MNPIFYEKRNEDVYVGKICEVPFPVHVHEVAEIVCITSGYIEMNISGKSRTVSPGDIAVIFPAIPHGYDFISEDAQGLTLIFSPETISEFTHNLRCKSPVDPILSGENKSPDLDFLIRSMQKLSMDENRSLKLGYLHLFLSYLFSTIELEPLGKTTQTGLVFNALQYIAEHYTEDLTLDTTARALGISRIHLSHIFSQQLRINFRQYINTLRIDRACYLLRDPTNTISQIVYQCGYGNPRTFHRAFLSIHNMTPKEYRARFFKSSVNPPDVIDEDEDYEDFGEDDCDSEE